MEKDKGRFGNILRRLRIAKGISERNLADLVGVKISSISHYENGRQSPKLETIEKISEVFDVPYDLLRWFAKMWPESIPPENKLIYKMDRICLNQIDFYELFLSEKRKYNNWKQGA